MAGDIDEVLRRLESLEQSVKAQSASVQRVSDRSTRQIYAQLEALIGLYRDIDGLPSIPPLRQWAISPDSARELVRVVRAANPKHVVECGSGASTVMLGHLAIAGQVGRITSLEHEPLWYEATRTRLRDAGIADEVELVFAPLTERTVGEDVATWYDIDVATLDPIDLVIVDGPPQSIGPMARWPAAPLLLDRCAPGCLFVLDDYIRDDEQAIADRWRAELPIELFRRIDTVEKGLAILEFQSDTAHQGESHEQ